MRQACGFHCTVSSACERDWATTWPALTIPMLLRQLCSGAQTTASSSSGGFPRRSRSEFGGLVWPVSSWACKRVLALTALKAPAWRAFGSLQVHRGNSTLQANQNPREIFVLQRRPNSKQSTGLHARGDITSKDESGVNFFYHYYNYCQ